MYVRMSVWWYDNDMNVYKIVCQCSVVGTNILAV